MRYRVILDKAGAAHVRYTQPMAIRAERKPRTSYTDLGDLQEALKALGYNPGPIDGVFGAATEAAVKAFQQAKGISADGVVNKVTWINIDEADQSEPVLRLGASGLPVRRLQSRMTAVGFDTGGVDGRFSPKTETAVKDLQQSAALIEVLAGFRGDDLLKLWRLLLAQGPGWRRRARTGR